MKRPYRQRAIKNEAAALLGLCDGPAYADLLRLRVERASDVELCHGALQPALRSLCRKALVVVTPSPIAALEPPGAHRTLRWYRVTEQGRAVAKQLCRSFAGLASLAGGAR